VQLAGGGEYFVRDDGEGAGERVLGVLEARAGEVRSEVRRAFAVVLWLLTSPKP